MLIHLYSETNTFFITLNAVQATAELLMNLHEIVQSPQKQFKSFLNYYILLFTENNDCKRWDIISTELCQHIFISSIKKDYWWRPISSTWKFMLFPFFFPPCLSPFFLTAVNIGTTCNYSRQPEASGQCQHRSTRVPCLTTRLGFFPRTHLLFRIYFW